MATKSMARQQISLAADLPALRMSIERTSSLDPGLRFVLNLIEERRWDLLYQRTGILEWSKAAAERLAPPKYDYLPLLIQFRRKAVGSKDLPAWVGPDLLEIAATYLRRGLPEYATARIRISAEDPRRLHREREQRGRALRDLITEIVNDQRVERLELPGAAQAFNEDALADIELGRRDRNVGQNAFDGSGVIVGIIDDGCAFAHPNFARLENGALQSRILRLWDQGRSNGGGGGWSPPAGFPPDSGFELTGGQISAALQAAADQGRVDEDAVYRQFDHRLADLAAHGTHVMDIAAGNGRSMGSTEGVAGGADIVFVQLPSAAVTRGGALLDRAIVDGLRYILDCAAELQRPAAVNISFGGYLGPHNGRSFVEAAIDAELANTTGIGVVVAAGNGLGADCHAAGSLARRRGRTLHWIVKPEDPTPNVMEIWYDNGAQFDMILKPPRGPALPAVTADSGPMNLVTQDAAGNAVVLGTVDHQKLAPWTGLNRITITLHPTGPTDIPVATPLAPAGTWEVRLRNTGLVPARYDAWIERDSGGGRGDARRMQSRFHPDDAEATGTLASYATGKHTIAVGGYNTATLEVARYSACGPTRDGDSKPEVMAPAEEDALGRGILCAAARSGMAARLSGTSAAAPVVTGLVALLLQQRSGAAPAAAALQQLLAGGAAAAQPAAAPLRPNAHIAADDRRRVKQDHPKVWPNLIGSGRVNWPATRDLP